MPTTATGMGQFSTVISTAVLTTTFADTLATFNTHGSETAVFYITYVNGTETSVDVRIEAWDAENGWFVLPYDDVGSGAHTAVMDLRMTADANKRRMVRRLGRFETQLRVSAIADTGTTDTSLVVTVQLGHSRYPISGNVV